jgi:toxin YoeB
VNLPKRVLFEPEARDEYNWWKANSQKGIERIRELIKDIKLHPFTGLGKPEPLKYQKRGYWSRHITGVHRLVYKIDDGTIAVISCRYHYKKR